MGIDSSNISYRARAVPGDVPREGNDGKSALKLLGLIEIHHSVSVIALNLILLLFHCALRSDHVLENLLASHL